MMHLSLGLWVWFHRCIITSSYCKSEFQKSADVSIWVIWEHPKSDLICLKSAREKGTCNFAVPNLPLLISCRISMEKSPSLWEGGPGCGWSVGSPWESMYKSCLHRGLGLYPGLLLATRVLGTRSVGSSLHCWQNFRLHLMARRMYIKDFWPFSVLLSKQIKLKDGVIIHIYLKWPFFLHFTEGRKTRCGEKRNSDGPFSEFESQKSFSFWGYIAKEWWELKPSVYFSEKQAK